MTEQVGVLPGDLQSEPPGLQVTQTVKNFPAMQETAITILKNHRAKEADEKLMPFKDIIRLIDEI